MKQHLLLAALSLGLTATAAHADDTFRRTLSASAQPDVYVSTGSGNIRITPTDDASVEVVGHVHAGWGAHGDVRQRIAQIVANPPITQSGNAVHIGESEDRERYNNISIDYELRVPRNSALNLRSGSGDIESNGGVGRFIAASSGSGNIRAHQIHGAAQLEAGSGDIELEETAPGNVKARSGSGNIRIHGYSGSLDLRAGSGEIEADGHLEGASSASSGSGNIRLHVGGNAQFRLEAATGSGSIRAHMPGVDQNGDDGNRHHLTATVNSGSAPLSLRTGSGDIEVTP
ncbi:DUF4097 family beta strand repeat-containing protein [Granulicella cerasi]|uniref:DUF4097 family beta strand repeat-containing protein n=1 Tax=Granulicella cerasi TaxID=741063 RepID=UPI0021DF633D|nr:DUF4097 domain-containing protein [Granulicella cerasi]